MTCVRKKLASDCKRRSAAKTPAAPEKSSYAHLAPIELRRSGFSRLNWPKRLGDVVVSTAGHADAHVRALLQGGQQNDRNRQQVRISAQGLQHGNAVHLRHLNIGLPGRWSPNHPDR